MSELDFNQNFIPSNDENDDNKDENEDENASVQKQPQPKQQDVPDQDQDEVEEYRPQISPPFLWMIDQPNGLQRNFNKLSDPCFSRHDYRPLPCTPLPKEQKQPNDQNPVDAEFDRVSTSFFWFFGQPSNLLDKNRDPNDSRSNGNNEKKSSAHQPNETLQQDDEQDEQTISTPFLWVYDQPDPGFQLHDQRTNRNNRKKSCSDELTIEQLKSIRQEHDYTSDWEGFRVLNYRANAEKSSTPISNDEEIFGPNGFDMIDWFDGSLNQEKHDSKKLDLTSLACEVDFRIPLPKNNIDNEKVDPDSVPHPDPDPDRTNCRKKVRLKESVTNSSSQTDSDISAITGQPQEPDSNAIVMKFFKQIGPNTCTEVKRVEYRVNEKCSKLIHDDDDDETGTIITTTVEENIVEKRSVYDDLTLRSIQSGAIIPTYHKLPKKPKKLFRRNDPGTARMRIPPLDGEASTLSKKDSPKHRKNLSPEAAFVSSGSNSEFSGQSPSSLDSSTEENHDNTDDDLDSDSSTNDTITFNSDSDDSCQFTGITRADWSDDSNLRYFLIQNLHPSLILDPTIPLLDLWTESKEKRRMIHEITQEVLLFDPVEDINEKVDQNEDDSDDEDDDADADTDHWIRDDLDGAFPTYNPEDYESIDDHSSGNSSDTLSNDPDSDHAQPLGLGKSRGKITPTIFTAERKLFPVRKQASPLSDDDDDDSESSETETGRLENSQQRKPATSNQREASSDDDEDCLSVVEIPAENHKRIVKTKNGRASSCAKASPSTRLKILDPRSTYPLERKIPSNAANQECQECRADLEFDSDLDSVSDSGSVSDSDSDSGSDSDSNSDSDSGSDCEEIIDKNTVVRKDYQASSKATPSPVQSKPKLKYPMKRSNPFKRKSLSSREDAKQCRTSRSPCPKRLKTSIRSPNNGKKMGTSNKENKENVNNNVRAKKAPRTAIAATKTSQPLKSQQKHRNLSQQKTPSDLVKLKNRKDEPVDRKILSEPECLQKLKQKVVIPKLSKYEKNRPRLLAKKRHLSSNRVNREYLEVAKFSKNEATYLEKFQRFIRLYRLMDYLNQELPLFLTSSLKYVSHFKKEYETFGLMSDANGGSKRRPDDDYDTDSPETVEQVPNYDDPFYDDIMSTALVLDPLGLDELPGYCGAWIDFYVIRRQSPESCLPDDVPLDSKIYVGTSKIYFGVGGNSPTKIYNDRIVIPIKLLFEMDQPDQNGHSTDEYKYYINACVTYHPMPKRMQRTKFKKFTSLKSANKKRMQFLFGFELENVQDIHYTEWLPSRECFQKSSKDKSGRMCLIKGEETHILQKFQRFPGSDKKKCKEPRNIVTEFYKWHDIDYDDIFFRENREIEFDFWNAKIRERRMARLKGRVKEETYYVTFRLVRTNLSKQPASAPPPPPPPPPTTVFNNVTNQPKRPNPNVRPGSFNIGEYLTKQRLVKANETDGFKKTTTKHGFTGSSCCVLCDGGSGLRTKNVARKTRNSMKTNEPESQPEQSSTVPSLPLIPRLVHKNDNYQVFVDFVGIQKNLICDPFACPFCYSSFDLIASLILHLELNHDRYKFETTLDPQNLVIRIKVELNNQFIPMLSDNPLTRSIKSKRNKRAQPTRRSLSVPTLEPVTTMISYGCDVRSLSNVFYYNREDNQMAVDVSKHMPQEATTSRRVFYHSRTMMPILPTEMDFDSENEEVKWPYQQKRLMMQDFIDVNLGEKGMMTLWNEFMMRNRTRFYAKCHLKFAVQEFLKQFLPFIIKSNMFNNCLLHFCTLFLRENLTSKDLCDFILYMMKMCALFQKLIKFKERYKDIPVESLPEEMRIIFDVFEMNDEPPPVVMNVPQSPEARLEPPVEIGEDLQKVFDEIETQLADTLKRDFHIFGDMDRKITIESFNDRITSLVAILLQFLHSPSGIIPEETYSTQMDFLPKVNNPEQCFICKSVLKNSWNDNEDDQKTSGSDSNSDSSDIIDIESEDDSHETITLDISDSEPPTPAKRRTDTNPESDTSTSVMKQFNELARQNLFSNGPIFPNILN